MVELGNLFSLIWIDFNFFDFCEVVVVVFDDYLFGGVGNG